MSGGQLEDARLSGGSRSQGGLLQNAVLTAAGHNGAGRGLTTADDTLVATGTTGQMSIFGQLNVALAPVTALLTGSVPAHGSLVQTLAAAVLVGRSTGDDAFLTASGTVSQTGIGGQLAPVQWFLTGSVPVGGTLTKTLADATLAASGSTLKNAVTFQITITAGKLVFGSGAVSMALLGVSSSGDKTHSIGAGLCGLTATGVGFRRVTGTGTGNVRWFTLSGGNPSGSGFIGGVGILMGH